MTLLDDYERRRERVNRDKENSARLATATSVFITTGFGSLQHNKRVDFGTAFIEKPMVAYGHVVDMDAMADDQGVEDSDDAVLPLCSGFVYEWDQDDRDFYIGCWVAVRVWFPDGTPTMPEVEHHFTFQAVAIKDIPTDSTDAED